MITLGIETSCDETALALIETKNTGNTHSLDGFEVRVIESLIHSQAELHSQYGGVYPNLAKREHGRNLIPLLKKILVALEIPNTKSHLPNKPQVTNINTRFFTETTKGKQEPILHTLSSFPDLQKQNPDLYDSFTDADFLNNKPNIDRIAVTEGPGLEPALWVGITFAQILSKLWNIPIVTVNHMEGHVVGSLLKSDAPNGEWQTLKELPMPALAFLISGGHTELVEVTTNPHAQKREIEVNSPLAKGVPKRSEAGDLKYTILGQTVDDAVGEAFDKAARLLGLPYPGGPHLSKYAQEAREQNIISSLKLPRPMKNSGDLRFSFSGLKTAVLYATRDAEKAGIFDDTFKKSLAREFEDAITETLASKLTSAIETTGAHAVIIGGGVSANETLRSKFEALGKEYGIPLYMPSKHISGDNALMIALAGALGSLSNTPNDPIRAQGTKKLGS